jgi:L-malate glycosyltransferase
MTATKQLTVCHVLHSMDMGGAEVLVSRLTRQLSHRYRIVVACLDEVGSLGRELQRSGFPVHHVGRRPGLDWKCVTRLGTVLRRERVNLVHAHQYTPFLYSSLARWLHRRIPVLFLEHGRHQPDYPRPKRMLANRVLVRRCDRILGVGLAVRQALIENEGISSETVDVVYNGIPLDKYTSKNGQRAAVRDELGVSSDAFVVVQVARLDPIKDHASALRCFAQVAAGHPPARFLIVGDGPERSKIVGLVRSLGLTDRVTLLGTRSDVHRILSAADVFLLTSKSEGIPLTVIEAMAARLPVVATNVGGMSEVVENERTGLLAPAAHDALLAQCIIRLAENAPLRESMGHHGRQRAEAMFSEDEMVRQYSTIYDSMMTRRRSQSQRSLLQTV